ncbi:MAG: MurR/RpiR family transcriptional regulator [Anaerolineae bacterium]
MNDDKEVLLEIKRLLPMLPDQERKVGEYILRHPRETIEYPITTLAEACGASTTTISRFCRRLSVGGYRGLKIELAKRLGSPETLTYVEFQPGDTLAKMTEKIFTLNIQALRDTQKTLDLAALEQVVESMLGAQRVDIYAIGGAGIAARELHFKCMQLGITANAFLDSQMQVMSAAALTPDDVGIGISHTGMQQHVAKALQLANDGGATTIAMTSYPGSAVAEAADIALYTAALAMDTSYISPSVRNAQLALVDVIYEALLIKVREPASEKMAKVAKAISDHVTGSNPIE